MTAQPRRLYVGSYTPEAGGSGSGITGLNFDPGAGRITARSLLVPSVAPSYLAFAVSGRLLYVCHEVSDGTLGVLEVGEDGALTEVAGRSTLGAGPCHVAVDPSGSQVLVANFSGGVAAFPTTAEGMLAGPASLLDLGPGSQGSHPHMVRPDPSGPGMLVTDLGLDRVLRHRPGQPAVPTPLPRGCGPRHLAVHDDGRIFVLNELDSTLLTFAVESRSAPLRLLATAPATALERTGNYPAELVVSPDGRRLYVSNRGRDTIAVFAVQAVEPVLIAEVTCGGRWPRHFALVDGYLIVANERSHGVAVLPLDAASGVPRAPRQVVDVESPTCVAVQPDSPRGR